jgi:uncharacterized membrane protein
MRIDMTAPLLLPATREARAADRRLPAIDVMRGFVMILMTVDHASGALNSGRLMTDATSLWTPGTPLPAAQFFLRWVTHLCAPTFVLLAGASLALSTAARVRSAESPAGIDRRMALRGAWLIVLEAAWMSPALLGPGRVLFEVLYAIGGSFVCMTALRRLPDGALLAVALALAILDEPLAVAASTLHVADTIPVALLVTGGLFAGGRFIVGYPLLPWLAILCAGFVLGRKLLAWDSARSSDRESAFGQGAADRDSRVARALTAWGIGLLLVFVVVRGANSVGNMGLLRDDGSLVQWLHVSKYPPSIAFDGLELGLACLLLAALFAATIRRPQLAAPVRVLGQVALFYYLLHLHALVLVAQLAGVRARLGITATLVGAAAALALLYPVCAAYQKYKAANPGGWRQYI